MLPFTTFRVSGSTCQRSAALRHSSSRRAAHACRITGTVSGVVKLPQVPPSSGTSAVSPMIRRTLAGWNLQLFGRYLRQSGTNSLPALHFAGEHRHNAFRADV